VPESPSSQYVAIDAEQPIGGPPSGPGEVVVRCSEVTKYFGAICAVDHVSVEFRRSEVVGLVGDNGAGKSTFVRMLSGIHHPDFGHIWIDGAEHTSLSPGDARRLGIETVHQDLQLCDNLGAAKNINLGNEPVRFRAGPFSWINIRKEAALSRERVGSVGVSLPSLDDPIRRFSGGQRQAVAIARALSPSCRMLILDEPTAALGTRQTEATLDLIRRVAAQGPSLLVISHNIEQMLSVATRVVALRLGRLRLDKLVSETTTEEIVACMTGLA
jgi:ABC-type sugar transport system ATPase subunit